MFRGSQVRAKAKQAEASSVKIQSLVRKNQQQKKFHRDKEAVLDIQRVFRGFQGRTKAHTENRTYYKNRHKRQTNLSKLKKRQRTKNEEEHIK